MITKITEANEPLAAAVHKQITMLRMELGGGDHLGKLLHIVRFDINNV